MTRVFSFEFSAGQSHAVYWEVGVNEEHHPLTHKEADGYDPDTLTDFFNRTAKKS